MPALHTNGVNWWTWSGEVSIYDESVIHRVTRDRLLVGAAERLRGELSRHGVDSDVHRGRDVALVSVWLDLVVWVEYGPDGIRYRWWTGRLSTRTGRYLYTGSPGHAVESAAARVAARYRELRTSHPLSPVIAELLSHPTGEAAEVVR